MKNDEHFRERGLAPNVLANIRMANERKIFRTEKTISKQNSRIEVWRERNLAKAPPGYSVNLEGPRGHPPEEVTTPDRVLNPVEAKCQLFKILYNEKDMIFNKKLQFKIFTNVSNFYKMKKQILLFVLFVVATFASISKSYGQGTEISPTPGVEYTYGVTLSGVTSNPTYSWYVVDGTTPPNLLTATQLTAGDGFFAVTGVANTSTYKLTWTAAAAGKTFYVVVKATAEGTANGAACTVENLRTYEVKPVNRFVLTASLSKADGAANTASDVCAPAITSATITSGSPNTVSILYGKTTLYFKIKAEGMAGTWRPSLKLPTLGGNGQIYESVKWTPVSTINFVNFPTGGTLADLTTANGLVANTDFPVTVNGSEYLVEVVIDNQGFETLADQGITLGVDGYLPSLYTASDATDLTGATTALPFAKTAAYTIKPRPTLTQTVPAFLGKNP